MSHGPHTRCPLSRGCAGRRDGARAGHPGPQEQEDRGKHELQAGNGAETRLPVKCSGGRRCSSSGNKSKRTGGSTAPDGGTAGPYPETTHHGPTVKTPQASRTPPPGAQTAEDQPRTKQGPHQQPEGDGLGVPQGARSPGRCCSVLHPRPGRQAGLASGQEHLLGCRLLLAQVRGHTVRNPPPCLLLALSAPPLSSLPASRTNEAS